MKLFMHLFITLAGAYVLIGALLFIFQRNFIYYPTGKYSYSYDTEFFYHDNVSIRVIVLNKGQDRAILYFGGNAEAVSNGAPEHIKDFPEYTLYLVNYRGYGGSSGMPQERSIYKDALYIYDQIKTKHTGISVMGRSLGSGVATYLSAQRAIQKMILVTPFDSIESLAQSLYPMYPMSLLLKDKYNSIDRVKNITAPTLIVTAEFDNVIPRQHSMRLINAFPESQLIKATIKNAGHNTISQNEQFHSLLQDFMQ